MKAGNQLGIYLRKDRATVVCLAPQGRGRKLLDCFSVRAEGEDANPQALCDRIGHACRERRVRFTEAAVALDCASFMQHAVHSEFSDPRKIAATVRFDTEETLAADVSDVAVTFRIASSDEEGARLDVFTAPRPLLTEIIRALDVNGIDPVAIDPDVYCLSRYVIEHARGSEESEKSTLCAVLSDCRGYLAVVSGQRELVALRTFLIGSTQDRTSLLAREAVVTNAGVADSPVGRLCAFDLAGELALPAAGGKAGLPVEALDLAALAGVETEDLSDCANAVDFALAYGAVLGLADKANSVSFRNDHMPFLGKKLRQQKAVRFLSISMTVLLLTVGVFFHSQLLRENRQREAIRAKLEPDYLAVMPGKTRIPDTMQSAVRDLERTLRTLKANKTGIGIDQESVSAKLTLVLQSLNACAKEAGLDLESISISQSGVAIDGTTSGNQKANSIVFPAIRAAGLEVGANRVGPDGDRERFSATLEVAKQTQGK